jgi:hypothetical protein
VPTTGDRAADPLAIAAAQPGALQVLSLLVGHAPEARLQGPGGQIVAHSGRASPSLTSSGTTPTLKAATLVKTSGRRCAAAIAQSPPLENPAAVHGLAVAPNCSVAHGSGAGRGDDPPDLARVASPLLWS